MSTIKPFSPSELIEEFIKRVPEEFIAAVNEALIAEYKTPGHDIVIPVSEIESRLPAFARQPDFYPIWIRIFENCDWTVLFNWGDPLSFTFIPKRNG